MQKKILRIILCILAFKASAVTIQNNILCIYNGDINEFKLQEPDSFEIDSDQPWKGIQSIVESGNLCLNILAGRHATKAPTNWVRDNLELLNVGWYSQYMLPLIDDVPENAKPNELNFAIYGTLKFTLKDNPSITYICDNVNIGNAGKSGISGGYIWWIFNNQNSGYWTLQCSITDNKGLFAIFDYMSVPKVDNTLKLVLKAHI